MHQPSHKAEIPVAVDADAPWKPDREFWWVYACLLLTVFMSALDQTIVATALPTVVGKLGNVGAMAWIVTVYTVAMTITMPVYGKIGDSLGRGRMFCVALLLFTTGSLLCGLSTSIEQLVIFRAVQGLGGGGLMVLSQAILSARIPPRDRARYTGPLGAMFGLASVLGPIIGGVVTDQWSWHWIFWINIPVGILALIVASRYLTKEERGAQGRFDLFGAVSMIAAVLAITALTSLPGSALYSPLSMASAGAAVLAFTAIFVIIEKRASHPLIPLRYFGERDFVVPTILGIIVALGMFATISYMPTFIQVAYGVSATFSGFLMFPMIFAMIITGIIAGNAASKFNNYRMGPVIGVAVCGASLFAMSVFGSDIPLWWVIFCLALLGVGMGATIQLLVLIAQSAVSETEIGSATAVNNFLREIGAIIGISAVGSLFSTRLMDRLSEINGLAEWMQAGPKFITPDIVAGLPHAMHDQVSAAYADALLPLLMALTPICILALGLAFLLPRTLSHTN